MRCKLVLVILILHAFTGKIYAQDTSKQFFSFGIDQVQAKYFFQPPSGDRTLEADSRYPGLGICLYFKKKKVCFNTGIQTISHSFNIKYPESQDTMPRLVRKKHFSSITNYPLAVCYELVDRGHWQVYGVGGLIITKYVDGVWNEYNRSPYLNNKNTLWPDDVYTGLLASWQAGVDVERNIYKRDIKLHARAEHIRELTGNKSITDLNTTNRISFSVGVKIMLSNIFYKDKLKTWGKK